MNARMDYQQNVPILRLEGKVTHHALPTLKGYLEVMSRGENSRLILDLSDVSLLDSAALGTVIAFHMNLRHQGGKIALVNPQKHVRNVLRMTRLDTLMDIFPRTQEALTG